MIVVVFIKAVYKTIKPWVGYGSWATPCAREFFPRKHLNSYFGSPDPLMSSWTTRNFSQSSKAIAISTWSTQALICHPQQSSATSKALDWSIFRVFHFLLDSGDHTILRGSYSSSHKASYLPHLPSQILRFTYLRTRDFVNQRSARICLPSPITPIHSHRHSSFLILGPDFLSPYSWHV